MPSEVAVIDLPRLQMREVLAGRWRCCYNCDNWREHLDEMGKPVEPLCKLFGVRPPTDVIITSCPEWFASGIPF